MPSRRAPTGTQAHVWKQHKRSDGRKETLLRTEPKDTAKYEKACVLQGEVVQIMNPRLGSKNGYKRVKLCLTGKKGWVKEKYLKSCFEGKKGDGSSVKDRMTKMKLKRSHRRFKEVQHLIKKSWCVKRGCTLKCGKGGRPPPPSEGCIEAYKKKKSASRWEVEEVTFITGQFLGTTGMKTGIKETLFHGAKDSTVDLILKNGFGLEFSKGGVFGQGNYFTPQACKAFQYSYDHDTGRPGRHIIIAEVALGSHEKRKILTKPDSSLNKKKVCDEQGYRSAVHHVEGGCYKHEERITYHNTQSKPVYVVKMKGQSPATGV